MKSIKPIPAFLRMLQQKMLYQASENIIKNEPRDSGAGVWY